MVHIESARLHSLRLGARCDVPTEAVNTAMIEIPPICQSRQM